MNSFEILKQTPVIINVTENTELLIIEKIRNVIIDYINNVFPEIHKIINYGIRKKQTWVLFGIPREILLFVYNNKEDALKHGSFWKVYTYRKIEIININKYNYEEKIITQLDLIYKVNVEIELL